MIEALEDFQRLFDDAMRSHTIELHHGAKSTGVVLKLAIVETTDVFAYLHDSQSTRSSTQMVRSSFRE
jgi:hypothetical protein